MASPFFGGPERQVLGLARALRQREPTIETVFLSFTEGGKSADFMGRAAADGFATVDLRHNWPHVLRCRREIAGLIDQMKIDVLCCNGYKPDIIGVLAARAAGVPSVSIAHGWTSATGRVRVNEWMDKRSMRWFDRVVGVSHEQSRRVVAAGVAESSVVTIHNGVDPSELAERNHVDRETLESLFGDQPIETIFVAAGRLSPEKGFDVLIDSMRAVVDADRSVGLVIFGEGPLRGDLSGRIAERRLERHVVMPGFRDDLNRLIPQADAMVLSSRTEGLPVILLEAMAGGVASVVTPVGGVGELVRDGREGLVVPVEDAGALAAAVGRLAEDGELRRRLGAAARQRVEAGFTHRLQAEGFAGVLGEVFGG